MNKYDTSELQRLISHHVTEIKRLANSNEEYKYANMALLNKEITQFKAELNK